MDCSGLSDVSPRRRHPPPQHRPDFVPPPPAHQDEPRHAAPVDRRPRIAAGVSRQRPVRCSASPSATTESSFCALARHWSASGTRWRRYRNGMLGSTLRLLRSAMLILSVSRFVSRTTYLLSQRTVDKLDKM